MNKKIKLEKGITLIALVITIIVLLILAGISIALLTGDNGILNKASEAAEQTNVASAKEQVELLISAYVSDYYNEYYVNGNKEIDKNVGDYVLEKLADGGKTEDYTVNVSGKTVTVSKDGKEVAKCTIQDNGAVEWEKNIEEQSNIFWIYNNGQVGEGIELSTENDWTSRPDVNFYDNYIELTTGDYGIVYTKNEIDFSQYKQVCFLVDNADSLERMGMATNPENTNSATGTIRTFSEAKVEQKNELYLVTLDISDLNETGKVLCTAYGGSGNRKIYQIYLVK